MAKKCKALKNSLVDASKVKHALNLWPPNLTPLYFPKRNENFRSHKNLYLNDYSSSIHNYPRLETTHMSFNR